MDLRPDLRLPGNDDDLHDLHPTGYQMCGWQVPSLIALQGSLLTGTSCAGQT